MYTVWLEVVKGKGHLVQSLTGRASRAHQQHPGQTPDPVKKINK